MFMSDPNRPTAHPDFPHLVLPLKADSNKPIYDARGQLVSIVEHGPAFAKAVNERHKTLRALAVLVREYTKERDVAYDSLTNAEGEYDTDDDRRVVQEMDDVIGAAVAVLKGAGWQQ